MKPDYSKINPMAYKCKSQEERNEIISQLESWGVSFDCYENWLQSDPKKTWIDFDSTGIKLLYGRWGKEVSSKGQFLATFKEIWQEWNNHNDICVKPIYTNERVFTLTNNIEVIRKEKYDQLRDAFEELLNAYYNPDGLPPNFPDTCRLKDNWKQKAGLI